MSKNEEDYAAYLAWQSNYSTTWALFSGFTFTAITMILFQSPNPTQVEAQISLFVLTVMLDVFLVLLYNTRMAMENCVMVGPPHPRGKGAKERPGFWALLGNHISWVMLGTSVILMFLFWNLVYLTLATTVVGLLLSIYVYIRFAKPWNEFIKTRPFTRK